MKLCSKCLESKSLDSFGTYKCRGSKLTYSWCKACMAKKCADWSASNPERVIGNRLRKYWPGVTWQEALNNYLLLLNNQGNKCSICEIEEKLVVDHCHKTGQVRGLLCNNCNQALGKFKDNTESLIKAIDYLNRKN